MAVAAGWLEDRASARGSLNTVDAFAAAHAVSPVAAQYGAVLMAAVQLYERHGFRYTGEQPDLFRNAAAHDGEGSQDD